MKAANLGFLAAATSIAVLTLLYPSLAVAAVFDVAVVGAGPGGIGAAFASAGSGAKTALAARRGCDVRDVPIADVKCGLRAIGAIVP